MIDLDLLLVFIPVFFVVSITPGMCMILAMSMGLTIGFKRSLWMMAGELIGVTVIVVTVMLGIASWLIKHPNGFQLFKYAGGAYLLYVGVQLWRSRGRMAMGGFSQEVPRLSVVKIALQGFVTAISNPKGWAFFAVFLPTFMRPEVPVSAQLGWYLGAILIMEFCSLCVYCAGGRALQVLLLKSKNVRLMNRISGTSIIFVAMWLVLS